MFSQLAGRRVGVELAGGRRVVVVRVEVDGSAAERRRVDAVRAVEEEVVGVDRLDKDGELARPVVRRRAAGVVLERLAQVRIFAADLDLVHLEGSTLPPVPLSAPFVEKRA